MWKILKSPKYIKIICNLSQLVIPSAYIWMWFLSVLLKTHTFAKCIKEHNCIN